jgi:hypothetical protein
MRNIEQQLDHTSVCPVAEGHCEVPRGCLYFYSLFFTALDALPCLALPLHCSALVPALPCFEFTFCCQGQEEEVTQGTLLLLLPPWEALRLWIPWQLEVESGSTVRVWPGWMKRASGWMDDSLSGRSQGLLHLHPQKYTGAESGVASPKAFIYRFIQSFLQVHSAAVPFTSHGNLNNYAKPNQHRI